MKVSALFQRLKQTLISNNRSAATVKESKPKQSTPKVSTVCHTKNSIVHRKTIWNNEIPNIVAVKYEMLPKVKLETSDTSFKVLILAP
jgi:hypothetical protein